MNTTKQIKPYPPTPELDKMKSVKDKSQVIGEFVDIFLAEKGIQLGKPHEHNSSCCGWDEEENRYNPTGGNRCAWFNGQWEECRTSIEKLLAEFFEINLDKCEQERLAVLDYVRQNH
jgi:hypothetical protein